MSLFRNLLIEKKRKPYYCEVEYLESTGTQYIDTGYKLASGTTHTFNGNIMWTQSNGNANFFYGYRSVNSAEYRGDMRAFFVYGTSAPPAGRLAIRYGVNTDNSTSTISQNQKYNISFDGTNLKVNGTTFINLSEAYTPANYQNMYLFYCNCTGYYSADVAKFSGRIYNWQMFEDGVLVRDLIPVLDWNYVPCMYDKISGKFFYNQGTGTFQYGREIHYVDYLESTGTQYINTGYVPNQNTYVELNAMYTALDSTYRTPLSVRAYDGAANSFTIAGATNVANVYAFGSQYWFGDSGCPIAYTNIKYFMSLKSGEANFNGVKHTAGTTITPTTLTAYMFARNANGTAGNFFIGRIYDCRLTENNTLIRDYIPAIDENGVGFMFDRVSHTCFLNQGTGAFKYPAREVEYLESDGNRAIVTGVTIDDTCGYDVKWMALNANDTIILGTKGSGDSRWVLSGNNNPYINISWNTPYGSAGLGLNKIQTAQMNYLNDRKRILNDIPLADISATLSANASTYNVGIFGGYWGSSTISLYSTCRIYYAKITKGTEFIRDFIPMIKDGSPCLFDKVGGVYYFGTGTGTFTAGKVVESKWF